MTWFAALLLSVVQALTEFFPVSSSGHLAILQAILPGFHQPGLLYDLWLHLATALAIIVYYRRDLIRFTRWEMLFPLGVTTAVTGVVGLLLHHAAESAILSIPWVAVDLLITGLLLLAVTRIREGEGEKVTLTAAILIGLMQGLAVFPGLSRSGFTLAAALFIGLKREDAARYSFIAAVPVIILASAYEMLSFKGVLDAISLPIYGLSFLVTFLFGILALYLFIPLVKRMKLHGFAIYCIIVAGGIVLFYGIR